MDIQLLQTILLYAGAVIGAASVIVKGVAMVTDITPTTVDDRFVEGAQRVVARAQKILGAISLDTSQQSRQQSNTL